MDWIKRNWAYIVIPAVYIVGVIGFTIPAIDDFWVSLTPINLLFGLFMLIGFHKTFSNKFLYSLAIIGILGYFFEVIGVQTGLLFGTYTYHKHLGPKLLDTPLMLAVNWALLIYLTNYFARKIVSKNMLIAIVGSLLMVGIDFFIEPFAIYYQLWTWEVGHVPLQNYLMWFILSLPFHLLFNYFNQQYSNKIALSLGISLFLFFLIIDVVLIW
ncbi:MAG: carotenoid biosynthesis protein [Chitinophagales bacterium]